MVTVRLGVFPQYFRYHVFVSYRSADAEAATLLTHALQSQTLRVWLDRDSGLHDKVPRRAGDLRGALIPGGDDAVEAALRDALRHSIVVAVVTSKATLNSTWVRREVQMARDWERPCFFWHVAPPASTVGQVSMRFTATPPMQVPGGAELVESVSGDYRSEPLAPLASNAFMRELSDHGEINAVGHCVGGVDHIPRVAGELQGLVEVAELVIHNGAAVTVDSIHEHWPEYAALEEQASELAATLHARHGRLVTVDRVPVGDMFRLKRPFVVSRVKHLSRLLGDDAFRLAEFARIDARVSDRK